MYLPLDHSEFILDYNVENKIEIKKGVDTINICDLWCRPRVWTGVGWRPWLRPAKTVFAGLAKFPGRRVAQLCGAASVWPSGPPVSPVQK